ncbi:hypothetical protein [uncultured Chryseobacterium sp.]|uniref:hypothetical protein n=1 Tax=uncultured Chryseobacterium sp. TaxID=259322 RepID=UPI0025D0D5FB|nr:hypothetical protein [uncultured Chryseobacterium sp.]
MKHLKLIIVFIAGLSLYHCSSNNSDSPDEIVASTQIIIPENIKGTWKVSYYSDLTAGPTHTTNDKGYYLIFTSDNKIKYKDVNGEFVATPYYSGKSGDYYVNSNIVSGSQVYITVQDYSNWFPGGYEFTLNYSQNYHTVKFYAKKQ